MTYCVKPMRHREWYLEQISSTHSLLLRFLHTFSTYGEHLLGQLTRDKTAYMWAATQPLSPMCSTSNNHQPRQYTDRTWFPLDGVLVIGSVRPYFKTISDCNVRHCFDRLNYNNNKLLDRFWLEWEDDYN